MTLRGGTREIRVGRAAVGGGAPVSVQSMSNRDPHDPAAVAAQAERCAALGCDIFRITVPDVEAAAALAEVKRRTSLPIVADVHFDWRCALAAIEAGCDALRINPGNIGAAERIRAVAGAAAERRIPIRIGVNAGSLEKDLDAQVRSGAKTAPEALCESALRNLAILEAEGFRDIAISAKASNVPDTLAAYRLLAERTDCPLHLGVTEAGTLLPGTVRSSVALGILLSEGIGDTVRVSLTAEPEREVRAGCEILRSLGMRPPGPSVTSCPTCGRTRVPLEKTAQAVEEALEALYAGETGAKYRAAGRPFPRVAVMGCAVNGPGEAKGADIALCGADGYFILYINGAPAGRADAEEAPGKVVEHVVSL